MTIRKLSGNMNLSSLSDLKATNDSWSRGPRPPRLPLSLALIPSNTRKHTYFKIPNRGKSPTRMLDKHLYR